MSFDDELTPFDGRREPPAELDALARRVIGAAIEVHRVLGSGLPEEAYEGALAIELDVSGIPLERQKLIEIAYNGTRVARGRVDLLIAQMLIVEIKSVETLPPVHRLQVPSYMRVLTQPLALLINFNVPVLKDGIRRIVPS